MTIHNRMAMPKASDIGSSGFSSGSFGKVTRMIEE